VAAVSSPVQCHLCGRFSLTHPQQTSRRRSSQRVSPSRLMVVACRSPASDSRCYRLFYTLSPSDQILRTEFMHAGGKRVFEAGFRILALMIYTAGRSGSGRSGRWWRSRSAPSGSDWTVGRSRYCTIDGAGRAGTARYESIIGELFGGNERRKGRQEMGREG
jgi:hypothetical protein